MIFNWYLVINKNEFEATGLGSRSIDVILQGVGLKTILVTIGNLFSITVDDVMLSLGIDGDQMFVFQNRAIFLAPNGDVYYGIQVS